MVNNLNCFPNDNTERVCRQQFQIGLKWEGVLQMGRKHCRKRRNLLGMSNFSFSHSVFKRHVLLTHKHQGLFGEGLKNAINAIQ